MISFARRGVAAIAGLTFLAVPLVAQAQERYRPNQRPLTITRHHGGERRSGVEVRDHGNTIVAWGGFSANGYGAAPGGSAAARRAARNELVRADTEGVYGYGFDGLGGTGFNQDLRSNGGYNNPYYGNAYNGYTGYGGVPTALAFGPGFASRHITDNDDDDDADDIPGPTAAELGYRTENANPLNPFE